jgi:iron complex outermembrane receptor protein
LWAPPLDRLVSLRVSDLTVRDAVDHLAGVARLDLSYSADLLPTTKRVCLALERVPVGAVLDYLLEGSLLSPIVLGSAQVVLAPSRASTNVPVATVSRRTSLLDRVVVTGSPDGAAQRGSPFALNVVDGAQLAEHGVSTLGEALELSVPGVWSWTTPAGSVTARYGSIRGASSFGVSAPKVYLDGIEVANPLLVTQLDPARVARVEVIRGPQGAALYGADAISGVVNILTRHDGTPDGQREVQLQAAAGVTSSAFAARDPFVQEHSLSMRRGSAARNVGLGVNVSTAGAYVPGASERRLLLDADGRFSRQRSIYTGFSRFSMQRANAASAMPLAQDSVSGQAMAQYTVGGSIAVMPSMHWTHTVIAGVDGYRLRGLSPYSLVGPQQLSAAAVGSSEGAADRASVRLRTVGRFDVAPGALLTLTLGAEQAFTQEVTRGVMAGAGGAVTPLPTLGPGSGGPSGTTAFAGLRGAAASGSLQTMYDNAGLLTQVQFAWQDRWFASAGVRGERIQGATPNAQHSALPMLGAAYVREVGNTVVKVRSAFGTGIRPARTLLRSSSWMGQGQGALLSALDPEQQSGTELGVDLMLGGRVAVHVTRFDQSATGLIQPVSRVVTAVNSAGGLTRTMAFTLQNVGAISNRGWEVAATARVRTLSLAATMTQVDSRVTRLAPGYRGDLRTGDRMLDVPAHTVSVSAAWTRGRWMLTSTAMHAADWMGYDRMAVGTLLAAVEQSPRGLDGNNLRQYWMRYGGVTRWRAGMQFRLRGDLALMTAGENLLDVQTGAPDNATVIAGRTLTFGVRTTF